MTFVSGLHLEVVVATLSLHGYKPHLVSQLAAGYVGTVALGLFIFHAS